MSRPSACSDWTIAQVLSHLGSQAEIYALFVDAGLSGAPAPSRDRFEAIWQVWDALSPEQQASQCAEANEAFVSRMEGLSRPQLEAFRTELFGRTAGSVPLLRMRLSEHAVHTWDVAVALDPTAQVDAEAVALLIDGLGDTVARLARPSAGSGEVTVVTSSPSRWFRLHWGPEGVGLVPAEAARAAGPTLELPAEALLRLVYGRLDDGHPPRAKVRADGVELAGLASMFPGF